jgi:hypothetical protein
MDSRTEYYTKKADEQLKKEYNSMSEQSTNNWNDEIETMLNEIRKNCIDLEQHHKNKYFGIKKICIWFKLPVIVLSSINALVAVSLTNYIKQDYISGANATISFIIGTLTSVSLYLKIEDRLETELDASKHYHKLAIEIFKTLSLKIDDRGTEGGVFLSTCFNEYIKLFEKSNLTDIDFSDKLKLDLPIGVKIVE